MCTCRIHIRCKAINYIAFIKKYLFDCFPSKAQFIQYLSVIYVRRGYLFHTASHVSHIFTYILLASKVIVVIYVQYPEVLNTFFLIVIRAEHSSSTHCTLQLNLLYTMAKSTTHHSLTCCTP